MNEESKSNEGILVRYAWVPLFLFSIIMLIVGLGGFAGPVRQGSVLSAYLADEISEQVLALRLRGSFVLGMVVFGMAIILIPLRRGEQWAWYVLWYYPIFFAIHVIAFGTLVPDGLFILISAASLLLGYPRTFSRTSRRFRRAGAKSLQITKDTRVSEILQEYGDIADAMELFGIKRVGRYSFRRMLTKALTVKIAARIHHVPLDEFLVALRQAVGEDSPEGDR